ncbi:hypothetical protein BJV78DRAFT_1175696, partial [Lactifluus subvellereus]
ILFCLTSTCASYVALNDCCVRQSTPAAYHDPLTETHAGLRRGPRHCASFSRHSNILSPLLAAIPLHWHLL